MEQTPTSERPKNSTEAAFDVDRLLRRGFDPQVMEKHRMSTRENGDGVDKAGANALAYVAAYLIGM